jgi:hypothetical protein
MLSSSIMDFSVRHWWVWRRASDWAIWSALMVDKVAELVRRYGIVILVCSCDIGYCCWLYCCAVAGFLDPLLLSLSLSLSLFSLSLVIFESNLKGVHERMYD